MLTPKKIKMFIRDKNLSGDSKVARYEIEKDSATIRFAYSSVYCYTSQSTGLVNISKMKLLAIAGKGLGS